MKFCVPLLFFLAGAPVSLASPVSTVPAAPAVDAAKPLPFDQALQLVMAHSLDVQKADETLASAADQRDAARYAYLPAVTASARAARTVADEGLVTRETTADVTASVNLYRFGADKARVEAASARFDAAGADLSYAAIATEGQAAELLISAIALEREGQIDENLLAAYQDNLAVAQRLYRRGVRPAQDVDKVTIDAANQDAQLSDTRLNLDKALGDLATAAGFPIKPAPEWPWIKRFQSMPADALLPAVKPGDVARADRQALQAKVKALAAEITAARAQAYPSIDMSLGYGFARDYDFNTTSRGYTGALGLTVPLFDRFTADENTREKAHEKALAVLDLEAKDREIQSGLNTARASFQTTLKSVLSREKSLTLARSLYAQSLKSFQKGVLSANELSLDQNRLLTTELATVQGWAAVHRSFVRYCGAAGLRLSACLAQGQAKPR